jgi:PPOX class probable F420-dependent enzyme
MDARASRPYMPGYDTQPPDEGTGLLPWAWAEERLVGSHDYWVTTTSADNRPHVTPVWGAWFDDAMWFSCSLGSRKARNLGTNPQCAIATDKAKEPVVVEGTAEVVKDTSAIQRFADACNDKYNAGMDLEFLDPTKNATFRVPPRRVIALTEDDFTGSPTRWLFD